MPKMRFYMRCSHVHLLRIFRTPFPKNTFAFDGLLLKRWISRKILSSECILMKSIVIRRK